jgi:hypothetical protein
MSEFIKGKVTKLGSRPTQFGEMYFMEVAGQMVGVGKYPPKVNEGDYIRVPIERKGNYINLAKGGKPEKISAEDAPAQSAPAAGKSYTPYNDDKRQEVISRQAARNTAMQFLNLLVTQEAVTFPKTAAPDKRAAILRAHLEKLTEEFNNYALGKAPTDSGTDPDAEEAGSNAGDFE